MAENKPFQLECENKFGNYNQFTDENGLQEYKNGIVINHMTGEEISRIQRENLTEIMANLLNDGWRQPTTLELQSILDQQ